MRSFRAFSFLFLVCAASLSSSVRAADDEPDFDFQNKMGKECPNFRCSSGYTPAPKPRPKFESTGCGSMGGGAMMMPGSSGQDGGKPYESCCHQWHGCYQICGASKRTCDTTFETCAKEACASDEKCTKDVELNNMMMKIGGCTKYDQAQYQACECTAKDQASSKREAAIRYFYKKQAPENVDKAKSLAVKADTPTKLAGLFRKLLLKYPDAIQKKEDPMQAMFDKIQKERPPEAEAEDEAEDEDEEKIEL